MGAGATELFSSVAVKAKKTKSVFREAHASKPIINIQSPKRPPMLRSIIAYMVDCQKYRFFLAATDAFPPICGNNFQSQSPMPLSCQPSSPWSSQALTCRCFSAFLAPRHIPRSRIIASLSIKPRQPLNESTFRAAPSCLGANLEISSTRPDLVSTMTVGNIGSQTSQTPVPFSPRTEFREWFRLFAFAARFHGIMLPEVEIKARKIYDFSCLNESMELLHAF